MNTGSHELRADCLRSLSRYFCEANETCKLILAVKKFPASHRERQAILDQRLQENAAFQDYCSARAELLNRISAVPLPTLCDVLA